MMDKRGMGAMPPGGQGAAAPAAMPGFDPRMQQQNADSADAYTKALVQALGAIGTGTPISEEEQKQMSKEQRAAAEATLRQRMALQQSDEGWAPGTTIEV